MQINKQLALASRLVHAESEAEARQRQAAQARFTTRPNASALPIQPSDQFKRYSQIIHVPRINSK